MESIFSAFGRGFLPEQRRERKAERGRIDCVEENRPNWRSQESQPQMREKMRPRGGQ